MNIMSTTQRFSLERALTLSSSQQEALKWLAILSMLIDHLNQITFMGHLSALSYFGRLAFPLFAFLIAYNLVRRDVAARRYVSPLLIFGLLSQPIYVWAFERSELNIFFTLLLGVLYVLLVQWLRGRIHPLAAHSLVLLLLVLPSSYVSYPLFGPFLIPILAAFLRSPSLVMVPFIGIYLMLTNTLIPMSVYTLLLIPAVVAVHYLPFELPRCSKWLFYGFYPLHLALLKLLQAFV